MTAWGRTGRVTLGPEWEHGVDTARDVTLPGNVAVGRVLAPRGDGPFTRWAGITLDPWCYGESLPSLDAAVMWVLRRAAPDVWRAERPVVWRVYRRRSAVTWGAWNWLADSLTDPNEIGGTDVLHRSLLRWADREARAEYARTVTQ